MSSPWCLFSIESVYSHRARVSEALCVKCFVQNVYKPSWFKAESVHFSTVIERSFGNSLQNLSLTAGLVPVQPTQVKSICGTHRWEFPSMPLSLPVFLISHHYNNVTPQLSSVWAFNVSIIRHAQAHTQSLSNSCSPQMAWQVRCLPKRCSQDYRQRAAKQKKSQRSVIDCQTCCRCIV